MICAGVLVLSLSIIPLSYEDHIESLQGRNMACMTTPWLLSMGFTVVMSSMFSKLARVNKILLASRFRRVKAGFKEAAVGFGMLFAMNFVLLLIWTLVDPLQWEMRRVDEDEDWKLYGSCTKMGTPGYVLMGLTFALNFAILLLACREAFKARGVSEEYGETKSVALALYSWVQIMIVGGPVMALMDGANPNASYFLTIGLVVATCCSMLLLIFLPMMLHLRRHGHRSSDVLERAALMSALGSFQAGATPPHSTTVSTAQYKSTGTLSSEALTGPKPESPVDVECASSSEIFASSNGASSTSWRIPPTVQEAPSQIENGDASESPGETLNETENLEESPSKP